MRKPKLDTLVGFALIALFVLGIIFIPFLLVRLLFGFFLLNMCINDVTHIWNETCPLVKRYRVDYSNHFNKFPLIYRKMHVYRANHDKCLVNKDERTKILNTLGFYLQWQTTKPEGKLRINDFGECVSISITEVYVPCDARWMHKYRMVRIYRYLKTNF